MKAIKILILALILSVTACKKNTVEPATVVQTITRNITLGFSPADSATIFLNGNQIYTGLDYNVNFTAHPNDSLRVQVTEVNNDKFVSVIIIYDNDFANGKYLGGGSDSLYTIKYIIQ